jgi:hypothetical protein
VFRVSNAAALLCAGNWGLLLYTVVILTCDGVPLLLTYGNGVYVPGRRQLATSEEKQRTVSAPQNIIR